MWSIVGHSVSCLALDSTSPTVAPCPKRTQRTGISLRVIDAFLVRAADDSIEHSNGLCAVGINELEHLFEDIGFFHDVIVRVPFLHLLGVTVLLHHDANDELRCLLVGRAV